MSGYYDKDNNEKIQKKAAELLTLLKEQQQEQDQAQSQAQAVTDTDTVNNKVENNAKQTINVNVDLDILFVIIFLLFSDADSRKSFSEDTIAKAIAMVNTLKE
ncbi:hypothetical protein [Peribacillus loiseleuriae]|uniref:Uncharacterized protein n=1 Tax=Peribacillus loiseleuriae TaxID=1679170 RepID=A0A0K9G414_9BACI|nr:hypothetical protein [Peribacillus loiseleuriae]KMY41464.1 hypothetical protein AC625_24920 [Peribacillus loiseleuriae]